MNDGVVNGYRYFHAKANHGIFARPDKVEMDVKEDSDDDSNDANGGGALDLSELDNPSFDLSSESSKLADALLGD